MGDLMTVMTGVLCVAMIGAALLAIREEDGKANSDKARPETGGLLGLPVAILAAGLVSLIASVLFLVLAAPDVAMTEAAIGSGLTTFLFFFVLGRIRAGETAKGGKDG